MNEQQQYEQRISDAWRNPPNGAAQNLDVVADGERVTVSLTMMDESQRAVAQRDSQAAYEDRLTNAWRNP